MNVATKGVWSVKASTVTFGTTGSPTTLATNAKFRIETILPNIGVPTSKLSTIVKSLSGTLDSTLKKYVVNCDLLNDNVPKKNLILTINGITYTIPPASYITDDGDGTLTSCTLNLSDQKADWVLGQTFLTLYYTTFDGSKGTIGIATYALE